LNIAGRNLGALAPILATAVASSVLTFFAAIVFGMLGMPTGPNVAMDIAVLLSIVFIWGPAFAAIPAAVLAYLVERPVSRSLIARRTGGFVAHLLIVVAAALLLWLLLRIGVVLTGPQTSLLDHMSMTIFAIVGLCSALSWWFLVIVPERRA
jgi:hypothetical protein